MGIIGKEIVNRDDSGVNQKNSNGVFVVQKDVVYSVDKVVDRNDKFIPYNDILSEGCEVINEKLNVILKRLIDGFVNQNFSLLPHYRQEYVKKSIEFFKSNEFSINIIDNASCNALIYNSKHIYINKGLFRSLLKRKGDDANWNYVAWVIAHEFGHIIYDMRVFDEKVDKNLDKHNMENQADLEGLKLMDLAGYNVRYAGFDFFPKDTEDNVNLGLLSTHPDLYKRHLGIVEMVKSNYWKNYSSGVVKSEYIFSEEEIGEINDDMRVESVFFGNRYCSINEKLSIDEAFFAIFKRILMEGVKHVDFLLFRNVSSVDEKFDFDDPRIYIDPNFDDVFKIFINASKDGVTNYEFYEKLLKEKFEGKQDITFEDVLKYMWNIFLLLMSKNYDVQNVNKYDFNINFKNEKSGEIMLEFYEKFLMRNFEYKSISAMHQKNGHYWDKSLDDFLKFSSIGKFSLKDYLLFISEFPNFIVFDANRVGVDNAFGRSGNLSLSYFKGSFGQFVSNIFREFNFNDSENAELFFELLYEIKRLGLNINIYNLNVNVNSEVLLKYVKKFLDDGDVYILKFINRIISNDFLKTIFRLEPSLVRRILAFENINVFLFSDFSEYFSINDVDWLFKNVKSEFHIFNILLGLLNESNFRLFYNFIDRFSKESFRLQLRSKLGNLVFINKGKELLDYDLDEFFELIEMGFSNDNAIKFYIEKLSDEDVYELFLKFKWKKIKLSGFVLFFILNKVCKSKGIDNNRLVFYPVINYKNFSLFVKSDVEIRKLTDVDYNQLSYVFSEDDFIAFLSLSFEPGLSVNILYAFVFKLKRESKFNISYINKIIGLLPDMSLMIVKDDYMLDGNGGSDFSGVGESLGRKLSLKEYLYLLYFDSVDVVKERFSVEWFLKNYPDKSVVRDVVLFKILDRYCDEMSLDECMEYFDLFKYKVKSFKFRNQIYDKFCGDFDAFNDRLNFIFSLFDASLFRDGLLNDLLKDFSFDLDMFSRLGEYFLSGSLDMQREGSLLDGTIGASLENADGRDKLGVLLWLMGKGEKVRYITNRESVALTNFDELKVAFGNKFFRDKVLEMLFVGNNGLFTDKNKDYLMDFLNSVFTNYFVVEKGDSDDVKNLKLFLEEVVLVVFSIGSVEKRFDLLSGVFDFVQSSEKVDFEDIVVAMLENYGFVGIKLAQVLSSMRGVKDLYPELINKLSDLKESAHNVAYERVMNGLLYDGKFSSVEIDKIKFVGSASIKVVLSSVIDGEERVVKVLRSENIQALDGDKRDFLELIDSVNPLFSKYFNIEIPVVLANRVFRTVDSEIDFGYEVNNSKLLAESFEKYPYGVISVPVVDENLSNEFVIVESVADGDSLSSLEINGNGDVSKIYGELQKVVLFQLFGAKFFHADLHSGNVFVKSVGPRFDFSFIDTGLCVDLNKNDKLYNFVVALLGSFILPSKFVGSLKFSNVIANFIGKDLFIKNKEFILSSLHGIDMLSFKEKIFFVLSLLDEIDGFEVSNDLYVVMLGLSKVDYLMKFYPQNLRFYLSFLLRVYGSAP